MFIIIVHQFGNAELAGIAVDPETGDNKVFDSEHDAVVAGPILRFHPRLGERHHPLAGLDLVRGELLVERGLLQVFDYRAPLWVKCLP